MTPDGNPDTESFAGVSELRHTARSNETAPSAAAVTSSTFTFRLAMSSAAVAKCANKDTSSSPVATYVNDAASAILRPSSYQPTNT